MTEGRGLKTLAAIATIIGTMVGILTYCGLQPNRVREGTTQPDLRSSPSGGGPPAQADPGTATSDAAVVGEPAQPGLRYLSQAPSNSNEPGAFPALPGSGDFVFWIQPISINGKRYPESIMVANFSSPVPFLLGRQFHHLRAVIGVTDESESGSQLRFDILVDGQRKLRRSLSKGTDFQVDLDITGAYEVKLVCANIGDTPSATCGFGDAEVS